ncbi:NAD(P)/FAD-dependent oxidoreductase [Terribacillus saccharophilus]|uniref:NAD(P)/FAD-dependent oxidoreductase n=1 Tax=Terribacillus saccharophilus TaxID=361277 RepID=UPI002DCA6DC3|nr:NAD(P)/FAD-dependent oxidoreductase [Terribacillus saccharophilus]MEC0291580.1 NAD(P)/FAD-dependent oxidoreductase [Terribacillus saccharophilus]
MMLDCAIIGGGPAGLNAALVLGRARRNIVLFDNGKPRNAVTQESHGFITRDGVSPAKFRELAHEDLNKYPSIKIDNVEIVEIKRSSGTAFHLTTREGATYTAKKIILTTGLKETLPTVPNIQDYYGKSLFSCPYCDGWELRDKPLIVISENKNAVHMAKTLSQWSKDLIVCTNGHSVIPEAEAQLLKKHGIRIIEERINQLHGQNGNLEKVSFADGTKIERSGGIVTTELAQSHSFIDSLNYDCTQNGGILVDELGRTSVEGVYAAGEASNSGPSQLIIAAAHGSRAAAGVNSDLTMEVFQ